MKITLLILLTVFNIWMVWKYKQDNAFLLNWSKGQVLEDDKPSEKAIKLLTYIRQNLRTKRCPDSFLLPIFRFLRPTPRQIAVSQGDCADKSRLLITLLRLHDVPASKVALHDAEGVSRHAVVEAEIENNGRMVMDAVYGLYFPADSGFYHSRDLQKDESLLRDRVAHLVDLGEDVLRPPLERYPYHKYTYMNPRSINWEKSIVTRIAYSVLHVFIGDKTDTIERPFFVERPAIMLLIVGLFAQLGIVLTYLPALWR
ncbi:MAG: hypothetical protein ACRBF0_00725 [Calditrichia bacterium]